jgi:hypothetical protein
LKWRTPRRKAEMRRYLASIVFAGCGLIASSPLSAANSPKEARTAEPVVAVQQTPMPVALRDQAAMVLVGTALLGLAAAVRRAA